MTKSEKEKSDEDKKYIDELCDVIMKMSTYGSSQPLAIHQKSNRQKENKKQK